MKSDKMPDELEPAVAADLAYEEAIADIYEQLYYSFWLQRYYMKSFAKLIARWLPRRARILDVGCGTGLLLAELQRRGFSNLIGVDLSPRMIEKACKNFKGPLQVASCYKLPFEDQSFDAVVVSSMLHHLHDLPRALREIDRVLQPYGLLFIREPNLNHYFAVNKDASVGIMWVMHSLRHAECIAMPRTPSPHEYHKAFTEKELKGHVEAVFDILYMKTHFPLSPFFSRVRCILIQILALWGDKVLRSLEGVEFFVVAAKKYHAPRPEAIQKELDKTIAALRPHLGWKASLFFHVMRIASHVYTQTLRFLRSLRATLCIKPR